MNALAKISKMLKEVDGHMADHGFETNINIENDYFKITGKEVIIKMPYVLKITIPTSKLEGSEDDISRAVSQAISQVVSRNK